MEVAPVLEVSRAEERGSEPSICKQPLRDGLGDGALPRSGQPIQPVDRWLIEVSGPVFNIFQDSSAGSLEATFTVAVQILSRLRATELVENSGFSYQKFASDAGGCNRKMF